MLATALVVPCSFACRATSSSAIKQKADPDSANYKEMIEEIRKRLGFTTLRYHRLDDLVKSIGISPCKLCTYCWSGRK